MLGDDGEDFLTQDADEIATERRALMGEKNLQPFTRGRRRLPFCEKAEYAHAALRPKIFPNKPCFCPGTVTGKVSPFRRRAASK